MLRFLAFGGKIRQDSSWRVHQDESWRILPPNARKRSTGALHRGRNAGKRSTGAVLRAKIEFLKKYSVCREGHFKLQKIAFEKISSIFSVLFSRRRVFHETGRRRGKSTLFLGEEFGSVARNREPGRQNGESNPKNCNLHSGGPVRDFGPRNRIPHPKIT